MIKTGKQLFLTLFLFFLASAQVFAQNTQVNATLSNNKVFPGEQVKLVLTISGSSASNINRPELPDIPGMNWLMNSTERSTSYTILNGRPSVTFTFTYRLVAQDPGAYSIPPIEVSINEKVFKTTSIPFETINRDELSADDPDKYPDVFVEIELDDESPVPGQQLIASVILYFKDGIEVASYQPTPGWKAEGFWKETLDDVKSPTATSVIKGGIRFRKAKLLQYALFPTKSGELELSPFEVTLTIRDRSRRASDFFNFGSNQSRIAVKSEPLVVNIEALPELDNAVYIGAVGNFSIERSLSTNEALVGESIEVITTIDGSGNVPLIPKPEFEYPSGLEKYEPQESSNISRRGDQITGSKKFSDILIARNPGDYEIEAVNVAYFNPKTNRYVVERLPALTLSAMRDPDAIVSNIEDLQLNIEAFTGLSSWVIVDDKRLAQSASTWLFIILPFIVLGAGYVISNRKFRMENDSDFARSQKAFKKAIEILDEVDYQNVDVKSGYSQIHKSLTGYIADKLALGEGTLSDQVYIDKLQEKGISASLVNEIKQLITKCSTISYVPDASSESLNTDLVAAKTLIQNLKKEF